MIYGLSTHLFAYEKLNISHLSMIADNGISTVEIFANSHQINFDDYNQLKNIENGIVNNNLTVNSVHAPFYFSLDQLMKNGEVVDIASKNEDFRKKSVDEIQKSFVLASLFQVDYFVLHFPDNADENILLKSLEILLKLSSDLGFKLTFENIPGKKTSLKNISKFLEKNMLPIGICYDIGHSNMEKNIYNEIEKYGNLFYTTHIHDNNGINDTHSMPFTEEIDWELTLKKLNSVYYKWGFILEVRKIENNLEKTFKQITGCIAKFKALENIII